MNEYEYIDELINDLITEAQNVTSSYEFGSSTSIAESELKKVRNELRNYVVGLYTKTKQLERDRL